MKKKILIFIPIIIFIILIIVGVICLLLKPEKDYKVLTIEINPSFEIRLLEGNVIKEVVYLNQDAKDLMKKDYKGQKLDVFLMDLAEKLVDSSYIEDNSIFILSYMDQDIDGDILFSKFQPFLEEKNIRVDFQFVHEITKADEKLASKYHISSARAAYINQIRKKNKDISIDSLLQKSAKEIVEMEMTGFYCDEGYLLDGSFCLKEIRREPAQVGNVCPVGTTSYQDKCYQTGKIYDKKNLICEEGSTETKDGKCKRIEKEKAIGVCDGGEYFSDKDVCSYNEFIGDAVDYCRITPESDMLIDHKCYGPKPMINGGCLNGDSVIDGWCIDFNSYYEADWKCPNGHLMSENEKELAGGEPKCYEKREVKPSSYKCDRKEQKLEGNQCVSEFVYEKIHEHYCDEGYTLIEERACVNLNEAVPYSEGNVCNEPDTRLRGDECIYYEVVEAKS